ncbi:hypothetical protein ACH42_08605 [Endozoicomonas sp. (ex Bugula neritina AB1)]|nr:hypothetical protein ACH42_08605 [Endozoicomonas sp. (ex Bugula neritina AB1)]
MPVIIFAGKQYALEEGENLLSGLLRQQATLPFSCRAGVCHSCLLKVDQGSVPENSQHTLSSEQIQKQCFLACQSSVQSDLHASIPGRDEIPARVIELITISDTKLQLTLSTRFPFNGQKDDTIHITSSSGAHSQLIIETINAEQNIITLTIKRKAGDEFSRYIYDTTQSGDAFIIRRTLYKKSPL